MAKEEAGPLGERSAAYKRMEKAWAQVTAVRTTLEAVDVFLKAVEDSLRAGMEEEGDAKRG